MPRYYLQVLPFLAIGAAAAIAGLADAPLRPGDRRSASSPTAYTTLLSTAQVARLDLGPQHAVGVADGPLANEAAAAWRRSSWRTRVRIWLHYDAVARA